MNEFVTILDNSESLLSPLIDHLPHPLGLTDSENRLVGLNANLARLAGFKTSYEAIGTTAAEMKCDAAALYDEFFKQNANVLSGGNEVNLDISQYADGNVHAFLSQKKRYLDKNHSKHVLFSMTSLPTKSIIKAFDNFQLLPRASTKQIKGSYTVISPDEHLVKHHNIQLTHRQSECFYYLLRGMNNKSIAKQMGISHRTVDDHVLNLKTVFGCYTRNQLIEKGFELGLAHVIPPAIFSVSI